MRIALSILMVSLVSFAQAQSLRSPSDALSNVDPNSFLEIQQALNDYYEQYPDAVGEKHWKRTEWFLEPRLYPSGDMQNLTLKTTQVYQRYMSTGEDQRATHGHWSFLGPFNTTTSNGQGRLNCVKIHPTNANVMYVGASNGGIWKSINGGSTWANISPDIPLLSIADIGLDPNNSNIIYALTGDAEPNPGEGGTHSQTEVSSIGIIKSTNGGLSWYPTGFSFDHPSAVVPTKLLIHPTNANIQFVAAKNGLYKTTNKWTSNEKVLLFNTYDIEYHPTDPQKMYCSGSNWIRRSLDGGATWLTVTDAQFGVMSGASRVELAVTPDLVTVVYAIAGDWSNGSLAFYRSIFEGIDNTWTIQDSSTNVIGNFADYCIAMAVSDTDDRDIFAGGVGSWRNLNGSGTPGSWAQINNSVVHADVHDMVYRDGAIYIASDGGLYKSTDDGNTWTDLSPGLAITEIYRIAGTPQNTGLFYCGNQDNGTYKRSGSTTFTHVLGGDGMTCQIDYTNINKVYGSSQNGAVFRSTNAGASFTSMQVPGGNSEWITPLEIDPVMSNVIFVGKDTVYRSDLSGLPGSWKNLGRPTGDLNCLEQGTDNRNRVYVSKGSVMYRTGNALTNSGAATWTFIASGLPNRFITGIAINPADADEVYVSLSGYLDGNKVFRSTDAGDNWTNISGSLPNVPANCIQYYSNGQYIGTDIGVFYRKNTVGDWIYFSNSMPAVNVSDLYINTTSNKIIAGTFGRGLWSSTLYDGCSSSITLGGNTGGQRSYSTTSTIFSSTDYDPELGTVIHYKAGNYIQLTQGFEVNGLGFFEGKIGPCPDITSDPLSVPMIPSGKFMMSVETKEIQSNNK